MGIPNIIRYEAQIARTGRAKCKICGNLIQAGTYILKILGFRINQSLHPECVGNLTISLADVMRRLEGRGQKYYTLRALDGTVKVGYYLDTDDPKKKRFTTVEVIRLPQTAKDKKGDKK